MVPRKPPRPVRYQPDPFWERSKEFKDLVRRLLDDPGASLPDRLSDDRRIAVEAAVAAKRWGSLSRGDYRRAMERSMNDTRPSIVAPRSDTPTDDVSAAWRQPEGRDLWERLISEHPVRRSSIPGLHAALGVLLVAGGMRASPHILPAHDLLLNSQAIFGLVSDLASSCKGVFGQEPARISYAQTTRHLPRIAGPVAPHVQITLAEIAASYLRWGIPVGRHIAVDGSLMPAWVPQRSAKINGKLDVALENRLRRRVPEAGFKVYGRVEDSGGVSETRTRGITRAVRGYSVACLVDIATGMPLTFDLRDASDAHEPRVLRDTLLPRLFDLSPDLQVDAVVGDGGYDDDLTHEHLETHYGIHLVAARRTHAFRTRGRLLKELDHPSIARVGADGIAVCRAHGVALQYVGLEAPRRVSLGLRPGQAANSSAFRTRFQCPQGCGKLSFPTQKACSNLPHYPHNPHGRLDLYAHRRALLNKRNQAESAFSSLQVGYKQCLEGAARVRVFDRRVTEALIALAIVTRALLALHAERSSRDELH